MVYARKASEGGGAVRLTNIIRGAQVVFGWLAPSSSWQLSEATIRAILAAFGVVDGKAVIKATNAYLNALAATDPPKASALAGFINHHPLDAALYGGLYVKDGLVFQMDRAYECTAAKWTDFIGGVEFNGTNVQIVDDVPTFGGNAQYQRVGGSNHIAATHTIEIIFNPNSIEYTHIYSEGGQGQLVASYLGNGSFVNSMGNNPYIWSQTVHANTLYTISAASNTRAFANKVALASKSLGDYWSTGGDCMIGARANGGNKFNGKIYGIRIYNRLLTEAEILANQDIDLKRFN